MFSGAACFYFSQIGFIPLWVSGCKKKRWNNGTFFLTITVNAFSWPADCDWQKSISGLGGNN
jgi:hypothetical protein